MRASAILLLAAGGCRRRGEVPVGEFDVAWDSESATLQIYREGKTLLDLRELALGEGDATIAFQSGSYLFEDETADFEAVESFKVRSRRDSSVFTAELRGADGGDLGVLTIASPQGGALALILEPWDGGWNRARARMACTGDDAFLGGGSHAFDVDHQGEAFPLFVTEPGIGKAETDEYPDDWYLTGTRHASSYPDPFLLRPAEPVGVEVGTAARVEVDLCASDPDSWSITAWEGALALTVLAADDALGVVAARTLRNGGVSLPPDWAFAPWNDAVMGEERVREVAATLREAGAPSSVIWTEDWKGAEENAFGYHLLTEWDLDEGLYPDAAGLDAELEAAGFKWLAYFSPFVAPDTAAWAEAEELAIRDSAGDPYLFPNPTLQDTSVLDLSDEDAWEWAQGKMQAALDVGFDGWMADYAEWLPPDAALAEGDALDDHNAYTLWWQALNAEILQERDATFFARSGWTGAHALAPVTWGGDQRTSFEADDGLPTVIPLGLGLAVSGVAFYGHDIAGYASIGNPPSDKELWFRWCSLGAFSPVMRTHHGAFAEDNWQFDSDEETLAHYARYGREHVRLFPYLRGLAQRAADEGVPLLLHPAMRYDGYDWAAIDAWMLGDALFVAPVLEQGATGRYVALPAAGSWRDWWTGEPAQAGEFSAAVDEIPVFVAAGSLVPLFAEAPDTLADASDPGVTDLADADAARVLRVFGSGGEFTEADGTAYAASGDADAAGTATGTFAAGALQVGGLTVEISGEAVRTYTIEVYP